MSDPSSGPPDVVRVGGRWELCIPPGWAAIQRGPATSLFKEVGGVGAVTVSYLNVRRRPDITPAAIADEFSHGLGRAPPAPAPHAGATAAEATYEMGGKHWLVPVALAGGVAIIVSYNCRASDASAEVDEVRAIIRSLRDR